MRRFRSRRGRAFTLVELMIVVAIIGVLAALAIYGVRKYLASSKTAEAKQSVGAVARSAVAAYERETSPSQLTTEGSSSSASSNTLCYSHTGSTSGVPNALAAIRGKKYQPNTSEGKDFETGDTTSGWKCLKFSISSPTYYTYAYGSYGSPGAMVDMGGFGGVPANGFLAAATGDLDGDDVYSQFQRRGTINATTGALITSTQVEVYQEFE